MRKVIFLIVSLSVISMSIPSVDAKVIPRFASVPKKPGGVVYQGITVYPRLRSDRQALIVNFGNLQYASGVTYTLYYQTEGKDEGVSGSIDIHSGNVSRELLFGTCSSGVCRYHSGLLNMRFEVMTELTSGKKTLKRFRIKI